MLKPQLRTEEVKEGDETMEGCNDCTAKNAALDYHSINESGAMN